MPCDGVPLLSKKKSVNSFDVYVEALDNLCYKQEKFTDTVNVFPFLCSMVRNCRDFHIQRKAKRFIQVL